MTAPPVARAPMICMIKTLMESTRETPDTADSPTAATITTSTIPTSTAMICSTIRGARSFIICFLENISYLPLSLIIPTNSHRSSKFSSFQQIPSHDSRRPFFLSGLWLGICCRISVAHSYCRIFIAAFRSSRNPWPSWRCCRTSLRPESDSRYP